MLTAELSLSLVAAASAFAAGFLIGARWRRGRLEGVVVVPASPPMRPPPPRVDPMTRSPYAPRPKPKPTASPPTERIVRWRTGADNAPRPSQPQAPPQPAAKPPDVALPKAPTIAAQMLPSIPWGQS
jgi:hypothetical protein